MKDGDIIVIDSVKELWDDKQQAVVGRIITDKVGNETKVKKGKGGKLEERWGWLDSDGIGKAIKLKVELFKDKYPFVADFEVVKDILVAQATEKAQTQAKDSREDSIEAQVAFKGMVELLIADKLTKEEVKATIRWAMERINLPTVIVTKIEEAKSETRKDKTDNQPETGQPSREALELLPEEIERVEGFLKYLEEHGKKDPRLWLDVEYGIPQDTMLTPKKCEILYKTIKTKEKW